jgi:hypothetical protein
MKRVLALLAFLAAGCHAQSSSPQIENSKVIVEPVQIYRLSPSPTQSEYLETLSKIREFVWEHWTSGRVGTVKLEAYSKEGEKTSSTFDIEFSQIGMGLVKVEIERHYVDRNPHSNTYRQTLKESRRYSATDVDRVKVPKDGLVKHQVISSNLVISARLYMLRLKDVNGKVITEI